MGRIVIIKGLMEKSGFYLHMMHVNLMKSSRPGERSFLDMELPALVGKSCMYVVCSVFGNASR